MNAAMFFQTLSGSNPVKPVNTKSVSNKSSNGSFKKEMDKCFDRNSNTQSTVGKNSIADRSSNSNTVQQKTDSKKYPEKNASNESTDITQEQQLLAAAQIQQPIVAINVQNVTSEELQQMPCEIVDNTLLNSNLKDLDIKNTLNLTDFEETGKGEIKLPFQSGVDLVKSAMINSAKGEKQENQLQSFNETMTKQSMVQEDKSAGFATEKMGRPKVNSDDSKLEDIELPKENVIIKQNNLDLSKVNIKVADAPVDTNQADMAKQLADKILYKISDGKQEFELELNPRSLGKINVKMIFQNGSAELIMSTSNSKAHQLLSMQADALRTILENSTGMDSSISLKQSESYDGQFERDNFQEQSSKQQNQQQHQKKKWTESLSFADRLRLGLMDNLEAVV